MRFTLNSVKSFLNSPYVTFLAVAVFAYWPISFLQFSIRWDMLDCYLPWRNFVSDSIRHGEFPLWNPYQQLGYPIHADLRTVWNPITLFISLFSSYTNYTLHFLMILYLYVSGLGMFKLIKHFTNDKQVSILMGVVYMLSGHFISHAQEISAYSAAAFLPFVLLYYLRFFKNLKFIELLSFCVFLFLMISTAYPGISIILLYLLLSLFLFYSIGLVKKKDYKTLLLVLRSHLYAALIMLVLCAVFIITLFQAAPYVSRMGGALSFENIMFGAFTPQSSLSFLLPFSTVKNLEFFATDITMNNAYFGVFILIVFIASLFFRKTRFEYLILGFGVLSLLASFGESTPIREMLAYLPLMDKFKFPSFFNFFTLFCCLILVGNFLAKEWKKLSPKAIIYVSILLLASCISAIIASSSNISFSNFSFLNGDLSIVKRLIHSTFYEHVFVQALIQFVLIGAFVFILIKKKTFQFKYFSLFVVIEMVLALQLNMFYTGVSEFKPKHIHSFVKQSPQGFYIPKGNTISENTDQNTSFKPLWRNTSSLQKSISYDSFNSFYLKGYAHLNDSFPELRNQFLNNKLIHLSDQIIPESKLGNINFYPRQLVLSDKVYNALSSHVFKSDSSDVFEIIAYSPRSIKVKTNTRNAQLITLLQSNYHGWEYFIDGQKSTIYTSNFLTISGVLPQGEHITEFRYDNKRLMIAFAVSYFVFVLLVLRIAFYYSKHKIDRRWILWGAMGLLIIIIIRTVFLFSGQAEQKCFDKAKSAIYKNDFSESFPHWNINEQRIQNKENPLYLIKPEDEFGCTFDLYVNETLASKSLDLLVSLELKAARDFNSNLVLSIDRGNKSLFWKAHPITYDEGSIEIWKSFEVKKTNFRLIKGDRIKAYIWNNQQESFLIDNFIIELSAN